MTWPAKSSAIETGFWIGFSKGSKPWIPIFWDLYHQKWFSFVWGLLELWSFFVHIITSTPSQHASKKAGSWLQKIKQQNMFNRSFDLFLPDCEQIQVFFGDQSLLWKGGRWENRKPNKTQLDSTQAAILAHTEQLLQSCKFSILHQTNTHRFVFLPFLCII